MTFGLSKEEVVVRRGTRGGEGPRVGRERRFTWGFGTQLWGRAGARNHSLWKRWKRGPPNGLVLFQSERRLGSERRLLGLRGEPPELDLSYSHSDLGKRPTKDSYTLTEELAEYAEIRVK